MGSLLRRAHRTRAPSAYGGRDRSPGAAATGSGGPRTLAAGGRAGRARDARHPRRGREGDRAAPHGRRARRETRPVRRNTHAGPGRGEAAARPRTLHRNRRRRVEKRTEMRRASGTAYDDSLSAGGGQARSVMCRPHLGNMVASPCSVAGARPDRAALHGPCMRGAALVRWRPLTASGHDAPAAGDGPTPFMVLVALAARERRGPRSPPRRSRPRAGV